MARSRKIYFYNSECVFIRNNYIRKTTDIKGKCAKQGSILIFNNRRKRFKLNQRINWLNRKGLILRKLIWKSKK